MRIFWILVASTLLTSPIQVNAENKFLTLGIFPYVSTSKLIAHNKNIRKHINETTQYKLSLVTAKNLQTYVENLKSRQYDFIFSAPHLARFVEKKYKYQRVAMTSHKILAVYLVKKDSPLRTLDELRGKKLSMAPTKTLLHQIVLNQLNMHNIIPGKDIQIKVVNTHNNSTYDVLNNDSDVAVTGAKIWKKLPAEKKKKFRMLTQANPTSGFIILAKPDTDKTVVKDIQKSLLAFNDTKAGKGYIFKGFKLISDQEMQSLDFHAKVFE